MWVGSQDFLVPWSREVVGSGYEAYDLVFIGSYEQGRFDSINVLADHGMTMLSATSIVFGMICQGFAVWLRWSDRKDRHRNTP